MTLSIVSLIITAIALFVNIWITIKLRKQTKKIRETRESLEKEDCDVRLGIRTKPIGEVALERKLDGTFNLNVAPHILHRGRIFFGRNAGDWIAGDFMHGELQQQYYHNYDIQYRALINGVPVEADTVSRYIGRVDQYKNPVFEGDLIVQYVSLDGEIVAEKSLIEYSDETCGFVKKLLPPFSNFFVDDIPSQEVFSKEIEVIGNKWDNPELMAQAEGGQRDVGD